MHAGTMIRSLNVLIPTCERPAALAVTLASLCSQTYPDFNVIISDQTENGDPLLAKEVQAASRLLVLHGHEVHMHKHLPRRGIAEQRQFLLEQSSSYYVLYLDDDVIMEPDLVQRLMQTMGEEQCGFVGSAPIGLSYREEERPGQQSIEFWDGPVRPERVMADSPAWQRYQRHSAANILHLQRRLDIRPRDRRKYHVAWIGACVLYDAGKLHDCGAFRFWENLPADHCGEEVLVQSRLLERYGGCGIIPSGCYHQELPATVPDGTANAFQQLHQGTGTEAMVPVSAGELIDKITILEIKAGKIKDPGKRSHVQDELERLQQVRERSLQPRHGLDRLVDELREVNLQLWQVEDDIRSCERKKDFGPDFVRLARAVYHQNDRRAALKRGINELTGSRLIEEKSYADYEAA